MKKRKILTKLGIIFGIIDLLLILFGVIFLKPKQVLAETPDSFLMNELYLFNRDTFNLDPNFENGYLMKTTILPTDINDDNTSGFFGWYQNLGYRNLIIPYYGSDNDNVYVVFGIPLNGITASNFQIAYSVDTPTLLDFYLIFTDGTYEEWNTEDYGFNMYIDVSNVNREKNCYAFCWEAYSPDYVPSFKNFSVSDGYDLGYQHGKTTGFESGFESGHNNGYNQGYQEGISSSEIIYTKILNFNQLINNGNFDNINGWSGYFYATTILIENNTAKIINFGGNNNADIRSPQINIVSGHQYFFSFFAQGLKDFNIAQVRIPKEDIKKTITITNDLIRYSGKITATNNGDSIDLLFVGLSSEQEILLSNFYLIDLTDMYGVNNEPNEIQCANIFTQNYYQFTNGTPVEIGYFTGYYEGKDEGLNEGINIGETNQINMGWIQEIFRAIQTFFNIQVFPHVTLGIIVGIPFIISLAWFVIKMFRGGGGGEE